ncbi:hypothetical protein GCM10029963_28640 [Micromonospora andamanensis]|uniref:hypothetical protein n=1 Tax=Micromonospora andamanensis TaxID=1287068 RepID=UPI001951B9DB|nr:hypothetical protein [Micromonospora andamanensis]GIJ38502.1 hypothetical protein Vwe01_18270 [Micromonospora andamanensis]
MTENAAAVAALRELFLEEQLRERYRDYQRWGIGPLMTYDEWLTAYGRRVLRLRKQP